MLKKIFMGLGIIFVLIFLLAMCDTKDNTTIPIPTPTPTQTITPELLKINAVDLSNTYKANEINADKLYKGRMIELTGNVYDISDMLGSQSITIEGQDFNNVLCFFKPNQKDKLATLQKGQSIVITGMVEGYSLMTVVKNCEIK